MARKQPKRSKWSPARVLSYHALHKTHALLTFYVQSMTDIGDRVFIGATIDRAVEEFMQRQLGDVQVEEIVAASIKEQQAIKKSLLGPARGKKAAGKDGC